MRAFLSVLISVSPMYFPPNPTQFVVAKPVHDLVSCGVSWCLMVSHCVSWCLIVSHSVSWCLIVSHCVSLCLIVSHCVSRCLMVSHCVSRFSLLVAIGVHIT